MSSACPGLFFGFFVFSFFFNIFNNSCCVWSSSSIELRMQTSWKPTWQCTLQLFCNMNNGHKSAKLSQPRSRVDKVHVDSLTHEEAERLNAHAYSPPQKCCAHGHAHRKHWFTYPSLTFIADGVDGSVCAPAIRLGRILFISRRGLCQIASEQSRMEKKEQKYKAKQNKAIELKCYAVRLQHIQSIWCISVHSLAMSYVVISEYCYDENVTSFCYSLPYLSWMLNVQFHSDGATDDGKTLFKSHLLCVNKWNEKAATDKKLQFQI